MIACRARSLDRLIFKFIFLARKKTHRKISQPRGIRIVIKVELIIKLFVH